jgi:hypothetical protein
MFKSVPLANRFTVACAILVLAACVSSCSTKSQLVGSWQYGAGPAERWQFSSDNTCTWQQGTVSGGECTYEVTDDGIIKIKFSGDQRAEGKIEGGNLILTAFGEKPVTLYKQ